MSWRRAGVYVSIILLVVALVSGLAWLVLWLLGYEEAAVYPMVIAIIAFVTSGTVLGLSRGPPGGTRVVTQDMVGRGPPGPVPPPPGTTHGPPADRYLPPSYLGDRPGPTDKVTEAMVDDIIDGMMAGDVPPEGTTYSYRTVRPYREPPQVGEESTRFDVFSKAVNEYSRDADEAMAKRDRMKRRWGYK